MIWHKGVDKKVKKSLIPAGHKEGKRAFTPLYTALRVVALAGFLVPSQTGCYATKENEKPLHTCLCGRLWEAKVPAEKLLMLKLDCLKL
jgi:hypothetical protein